MWGKEQVQAGAETVYLAQYLGKVPMGLARQVCAGVLGPLAEKALHFSLAA